MTEQGNQGNEVPDKQVAENNPGAEQSGVDIAGGGLASGEVRSVTPPQAKKSSSLSLVLLLLIVVLLGSGYLFVSYSPAPAPASNAGLTSTTLKQPMPLRQKDQQPVAEESLEQRPVVAVDSVATSGGATAEKTLPPSTPAASVTEPTQKPVSTPPTVEVASRNKAAELVPASSYQVLVGPFIAKARQDEAVSKLQKLGFTPQKTRGRGFITMTRLLEGLYPAEEARQRILALKKITGDAFMLPVDGKRAIYVGSFNDAERAADYAAKLADKGVKVTLVASEVEMTGSMLLVVKTGEQDARKAVTAIGRVGLVARMERD